MSDQTRYVNIRSSIVKSTPVIRIGLRPDEPIQPAVLSALTHNCSDQSERRLLAEQVLHVRHGDSPLSKLSRGPDGVLSPRHASLSDLSVPPSHEIDLLAEVAHDDFHGHCHLLRVETPTSLDVDRFHEWTDGLRARGAHFDLWRSPVAGAFADIKVLKNVKADETGLAVSTPLGDLKEKIEESKRKVLCSPEDFHKNFHSYEEITEWLKFVDVQINRTPGMSSQVFSIGKSTEGRDTLGIRIKRNNPKLISHEKILLVGGMHAREWSGVSTMLYIADSTRNENDSFFSELLSYAELHIIPIANADGYEYSRNTDRLWRKNTNNHFPQKYHSGGVDINRNFNVNFGEYGASPKGNSEIYNGPFQNSEVETRNLVRYFTEQKGFLGGIDFHCYMGSMAFPYAHSKKKHPQYDLMKQCGGFVSSEMQKVNKNKYNCDQVSSAIYRCSGTMMDFLYENGLSPFSFAVELSGESFLTPPSEIESIGMESLVGLKSFLHFVLSYRGSHLSQSLSPHKSPAVLASQSLSPSPSALPTLLSSTEKMKFTPTGLKNFGNNCYANSVLQSLSALQPLCAALRSGSRRPSALGASLTAVLLSFWGEGARDSESTQRQFLRDLFASSSFERGEMADASHLTLECVDALADSSPRAKALFDGELETLLEGRSIREPFFHASLALPALPQNGKTSLVGCLKEFFTVGNVTVGNHTEQMASKITKLPRILVITLKRNFSQTPNVAVEIPETISLSNYTAVQNKSSADGSYILRSFIEFLGRDNSCGHYLATLRPSGASEWMVANDSVVRPLSQRKSSFESDTAHVLFYERADSTPPRNSFRKIDVLY